MVKVKRKYGTASVPVHVCNLDSPNLNLQWGKERMRKRKMSFLTLTETFESTWFTLNFQYHLISPKSDERYESVSSSYPFSFNIQILLHCNLFQGLRVVIAATDPPQLFALVIQFQAQFLQGQFQKEFVEFRVVSV